MYQPHHFAGNDGQFGSWLSNIVHKVVGGKSGAEKKAEADLAAKAVAALETNQVTTTSQAGTQTTLMIAAGAALAVALLLRPRSPPPRRYSR